MFAEVVSRKAKHTLRDVLCIVQFVPMCAPWVSGLPPCDGLRSVAFQKTTKKENYVVKKPLGVDHKVLIFSTLRRDFYSYLYDPTNRFIYHHGNEDQNVREKESTVQ